VPPLSPTRRKARARHAALTRHHPDTAEAIEAWQEVAALALEEHIRELVAGAPPLSDAQRSRLAAILQPAVAEVAAERQKRQVSRGAA
jgi:hypothetical protein